jgi:hypothetical protein
MMIYITCHPLLGKWTHRCTGVLLSWQCLCWQYALISLRSSMNRFISQGRELHRATPAQLPNGNSNMMFQLQQQTPTQSTTPTWDSNSHGNASPRLQLNCSLLGETSCQMTTPTWDSNSIADSLERLKLIDCQLQHDTPDPVATPT